MSFDLERARDAVLMYNVNKTVWAHGCAEHLPGAIDLIESQTAEIERLRSAIMTYREREESAFSEIEMKDEFLVRQNARIKELEDALVEAIKIAELERAISLRDQLMTIEEGER